ncbi:MAG: hypothetical protein K2J62_09905 [Bacteroidales bacterium]|nr:hypothetical protein [Bacteroidales bacterium]
MQNRLKITMLAIAALSVWGIVAVRLVISFRTGETEPEVAGRNMTPIPHVKDTLVLEYLDPFLRDLIKDKANVAVMKKLPETAVDVMEPVPAVDFLFKGILGVDGSQFGVAVRGGEVFMLQPGDLIGDFIVIGFSPEHMTVRYRGAVQEVRVI